MSTTHTNQHKQRFILLPLSIILLGVVVFFFWYNYRYSPYEAEPVYGVTFSTKYSTELGIDWREAFIASLDDLGVREFRIPVYWDEIESARNQMELENIQWILDEAEARNARVFLAVGQRVPRWPECHPPAWLHDLPVDVAQAEELAMIEEVVLRFKDHPALTRWQVQNEAYFQVFGECPPLDEEFIQASVQLVRSIDPDHPILMTDSGELSTWIRPSRQADVLGISMYRVTWNNIFGYFYYPLPPAHYSKKAELLGALVDDIVVSELQVEPWVPTNILDTPLDEQYRSMDVDRFHSNIDYVRRTGFSEVYLWGVEWWYWLEQEHGDSSMWDAGRDLFRG